MMRTSLWGARLRRAAAAVAVVGILSATATAPVGAAATPAGPVPAQNGAAVGPVNPVAEALSFGVMTEGDANLERDENEGTAAIGGDLTFGNYQLANNTAGSFTVPGDARPTALVVGGRVNFAGSVAGTRLQILSSGYAKVGNLTGTFVRDTDNNGAAVNTRILPTNNYDAFPRVELTTRQPVASVGPTSPINFAAAFQSFRGTSTSLATCDNTVVLRTPNGDVLPRPIPPGSNAVVRLTSGVTNVLNIGAADLNNIETLTFADQPTATTPLLINVDTTGVGNTFDWTAPNFSGVGGEQARYVLLNFPTATRLTLTPQARTIEGSIYAPNADFIDLSSANVEGSIITRTLDHRGGEIHYFPFSTTLACGATTPASIDVVKSSTTVAITTVGQQVPYEFHVVNTGGVALTEVSVADVQTPPSSNANLGPITCAETTLAPGADTVCTATYTVTQADLDNEGVSNTATASGLPPDSETPVTSPPSELTIPAQQIDPSISVVKSSTTAAITQVGQQVPYRFLVTNTGEVTLTQISVTDVQTPPSSNANLGPITCGATTLAPGGETVCTATYTVTQADIDNGSVSNTATASGLPPGSQTPVTSPPSELTIPTEDIEPAISVTKSSTTTAISQVGQQVPYRFLVVNAGGLTLTQISVTDVQTPPSSNANLGPITCAATTLAPGAATTCTATYTVTQADLDNGGVSNTATASGLPPGSQTPVTSPPSELTIPTGDVEPAISLTKTSTTVEIITVGQQVQYRFHVVNTGGLTLTQVSVTDVQTPPSSNADLGPVTCAATTLAPGAETACTATYTVTQADLDNGGVSNTATASGLPPGSETPITSPPSELTIPAEEVIPAIAVVKSSTTVLISQVGQQVPYRFHVVNTGGLTLTSVSVTDVQTPPSSNADLGPITCAATTLAPGEDTICTATYTVTQADLDNGGVSNTATASGLPPGSDTPVTSPPSQLTIPQADVEADIAVVKASSTPAITVSGQEVPYTYLVVNTGGLTLTNVTVNDTELPPADRENLGPITCGPDDVPNGTVTLAPGESVECRAVYTVSPEDFAQAALIDVATATGTPPTGPAVVSPPSPHQIPVLHPAIELVKSATPTEVHRPGDTVTYRFVVTNTGNTELTDVTVEETEFSGSGTLSPITCGTPPVPNGEVTLEPGESVTCTARYTVTKADIKAGRITDTAVAVGTPPRIPDVPPLAQVESDPSSATVTTRRSTGITIKKYSSVHVIYKVGQEIPYRFRVTNTGTVPLTEVTVTDTLIAPADPANLGPITCGPNHVPNGTVTLAPGQSVTCEATYTVSYADRKHGKVSDRATASGQPPSGPPVVSAPAWLTIRFKGHLPITGASLSGPVIVGATLAILLGSTLLVIARRRRTT